MKKKKKNMQERHVNVKQHIKKKKKANICPTFIQSNQSGIRSRMHDSKDFTDRYMTVNKQQRLLYALATDEPSHFREQAASQASQASQSL